MKIRNLLIITSIIFVLSGSNLYSQRKQTVTPDDLKAWVSYLASDEMKGRANGSAEMKTASDWIAGKFKEYGVMPLFQDNNYIQNYSYQSRQRNVEERNVIGVIEGTDPSLKDQYIVISAHFDHIGIRHGAQPDSICNGADDNAAGTCTLIGIAKSIHDPGIKPGRTVVLAAFSGEENGMRGSRYFVTNSPINIKNIYADVNFEMIGHSEFLGKNKYYMTGTQFSNLDDVISQFNKNSPFQLIDTIEIAKRLFYGSDNISFSTISVSGDTAKGIPSGTFATATMVPYLHTPSDEVKLFDFENMAGLVNYFSDLVIWLSKNKTEIIWTDPKFSRPK